MKRRSKISSSKRFTAGAFTIVEASISVVIVAVMLTAVLQTVGMSGITQYKIAERTRGEQLARALLAEVAAQTYADAGASPVFGPESGETRATYDDVDDYSNLSDSPPTQKDGTAISIPAPSGWRRTVAVVWLNPATLAVASPQAESGAKRITVTVYHNNIPVATAVSVRTNVQ